jgi:glutamate-1-semialdehyde 2,1-aminomutase
MKTSVDTKTDRSRSLFERALEVTPGGVHSDVRGLPCWEPYPIFVDRGKGSKIYDVDGNEYIDYRLAYGPLILGHAHSKIIDAVRKQLERGYIYGACHESEIELAEKIIKHVPCAEMVKFSNTGTEAVLYALRLARAYTQRDKIVKFEGHYHGWSDDAFVSVHPPIATAGLEEAPTQVLGSPGIIKDSAKHTLVLPWNNPKALEKCIKDHDHEIAAVIAEPLTFTEEGSFLKLIREITVQNDIVMILDEIKTGFRLGLGGAQGYYGITPDLAVLGKAFGGGFPISAIVGRKEVMKLFEGDDRVAHAGTYNSNPISIAAALATLEELESDDGKAYTLLFKVGKKLIDGLRDLFEKFGVKGVVQGCGAMFNVFFVELDVRNYRDVCTNDDRLYREFWREALKRGVLFDPSALQRWYVSTAHTEKDVEQTLIALGDSLKTIKVLAS